MLPAFETRIVLEIKSLETRARAPGHAEVLRIKGNFKGLSWSHSYTDAIKNIQERTFAYYICKENTCLTLEVATTADGGRCLAIQGRTNDLLSFFA